MLYYMTTFSIAFLTSPKQVKPDIETALAKVVDQMGVSMGSGDRDRMKAATVFPVEYLDKVNPARAYGLVKAALVLWLVLGCACSMHHTSPERTADASM
jgi:hypothetical protein